MQTWASDGPDGRRPGRVASPTASAGTRRPGRVASPTNLQIHTTPPAGFAGINTTTLTWNANTESNLAGYEVVMRETTSPDWTDSTNVCNVTTVTLDIAKDNVQFGVRTVDQDGNRSPVAFPAAVA